LASIRTVLDLAEKCLDGCPIWGPKAAVAAMSESLETVQVRTATSAQRSLGSCFYLQTQLDNEEDIDDVVGLVQKMVEILNPSMATSLRTVSPELQSRIANHALYAPFTFLSDNYLTYVGN
jgi:hypothetical protein